MARTEALADHMRNEMTQELCDEVEAVFALVMRQALDIEMLTTDVTALRKICGLSQISNA